LRGLFVWRYMNRETKFRAWNKENGMSPAWSLEDLLQASHEGGMDLVSTETVFMHITGFRDARKQDAYDGDIFECDLEWYCIEWDIEGGCWFATGLGTEGMELSEFVGTPWFIQGNVYEHPEMMERFEKAQQVRTGGV
jgi:hypothetical protein